MDNIDDTIDRIAAHFKASAECAIKEATRKVESVLKVSYAPCPQSIPSDLPAPRIQFRWVGTDGEYICHYEFVFPLGGSDIRSTDFNGSRFAVIELGRTTTSRGRGFDGDLKHETPFRDGAHAQWDAKSFGDPPIYIIAPNGRSQQFEPRSSP